VAVISDLHRYREHFQKIEVADSPESLDAAEIQKVVDIVPSDVMTSREFQALALNMLLKMERDRFNLPWRWNHWSNLFAHAVNAISCKRLRDQHASDQAQ